MNSNAHAADFTTIGFNYVEQLQRQGRHSSAHIYLCALHSFHRFMKATHVAFEAVSAVSLKAYERHLQAAGASANTISTYLRMLRSIYNRGVDAEVAPFRPRLFSHVYTGIDSRRKKALDVKQLHRLLYARLDSMSMKRTQLLARAIFQLCGIPFADFARLRAHNVDGSILTYRRKKTGIAVSIELLPCIRKTMSGLCAIRKREVSNDFLFDLLPHHMDAWDSHTQHKCYNTALRRFNRQLQLLAQHLGISEHVSSYTLRHSWATLAKRQGSPVEAISEMLGHTSIRTTQIYLKGFELQALTKVNQKNCNCVMKGI